MHGPFYIERCNCGNVQWLFVDEWYYEAWNGCFCLICDKQKWKIK